jgi:hypothetical protein
MMVWMQLSQLMGRERELVAPTDMIDDATEQGGVLVGRGGACVRRSSLIMKGAAHVVAVD